jgi:hypothetical protein
MIFSETARRTLCIKQKQNDEAVLAHTVFGEGRVSRSFLLCSFLQPSFTHTILSPKIPLSTLNTIVQTFFPLVQKTKSNNRQSTTTQPSLVFQSATGAPKKRRHDSAHPDDGGISTSETSLNFYQTTHLRGQQRARP